MKAMESKSVKRFSVKRIGIAAVALGTLAIGLVGANAVHDATQTGSDARPVAVTRSIAPVDQVARYRFLEMNTQLPTGSVAVAPGFEQIRFLEMNVLPGDPGTVEPRVPNYRLIDQNVLPGDDQPNIPPYSDNTGQPY